MEKIGLPSVKLSTARRLAISNTKISPWHIIDRHTHASQRQRAEMNHKSQTYTIVRHQSAFIHPRMAQEVLPEKSANETLKNTDQQHKAWKDCINLRFPIAHVALDGV